MDRHNHEGSPVILCHRIIHSRVKHFSKVLLSVYACVMNEDILQQSNNRYSSLLRY